MVTTRFAPSPTGYLHIGGVRTALFSWLHARKHGGRFILRIEDTDQARSTEEAVQVILDGMAWLDLDYDAGPIYQTQRFDRYAEVLQQLLDSGHAYRCYCSKERLEAVREQQTKEKRKPRYDGHCRDRQDEPPGIASVIRFRNPQHGNVLIDDLVRGAISINNSELDDLILARSDGTPTYNFTVVVDDMDMQITHVIRGDDHINNTPRQINILRALGAELPYYAHVPMILGADGKRLSKRHGAVSVLQYSEQGYLPEALLNYLVRLSWAYGDQEVFSREEMITLFDITKVNKAPATFNPEKLLWLNQHYLKHLPSALIAERLQPFFTAADLDPSQGPDLQALVEIQRDRCKTLLEMTENSTCFYREFDHYNEQAAAQFLSPASCEVLQVLHTRFTSVSEWETPVLQTLPKEIATELGLKMINVAQPLRVALTGNTVSPSIDITLKLIGRARTLRRLERAIAYIQAHTP